MSRAGEPNAHDARPDPLAFLDAITALAEHLDGAVAVFVARGWTVDQARAIVLRSFLEPTS